ncbi:xanthine dehydrogenase family protein molybdopterin-binding subunit [Acuticoccus sp. M5D2P5]|uniref:xanthine dehydrogenase family protein molybdopterin-binding subunit n=1 Tax=Acuticoccus kalidii TaxID=2910977 RepID=UPI001F28D8A8|nr:xanthine dehydrogenase family protein molybdopterin-binding subunit [Acuticoccus kalidii]MCF3936713.1 xanthine dehydrogenase family protein molybdopterin-binding subunit [Acuticoccus kalidii]
MDAKTWRGWIGRPLTRREDDRLVRGNGCFVADIVPPGCLHLAFVRSPVAGVLFDLDLSAAQAMAEIVAIFTAEDVPIADRAAVNALLPDFEANPGAILAEGRADHVGQPLAAIVARTPMAARDAADAVRVEPGAPVPPPGGRVHHLWRRGDADAAFAAAVHRVAARVDHALVAPAPLEPRAALAEWRDGRLIVSLSTQTPNRCRDDIARVLGLPREAVRVVAPDVGGAFGGKASIFPEDLMVAAAARALEAPVRWVAERGEDMMAATLGRGGRTSAEMALDADGRILALRASLDFPLGARTPYSALAPGRNAARVLPGPYLVPTVHIALDGAGANTAPVGIYRGAGRPEAALLMERLMDKAARQSGLDPFEIRRRNLIPSSAFPHATATGETYDSADLEGLLAEAERAAAARDLTARRDRLAAQGLAAGVGLCLYIEPCGAGWETASLALTRKGRFRAATGSSTQGQGRETMMAQIIADALTIAPDRIDVVSGDTDHVADGIGALASRSTAIGGSAMWRAAEAMGAAIKDAAAPLMQCAPEAVSFSEAGVSAAGGAALSWSGFAAMLGGEGDGLTVTERFTTPGETWASGAALALVAIDPDTGAPSVEDLVWIDDAGRIVNPLLAEGQLVGGMAQAIGTLFMERIVYDEDGQLLTGSFMDYAMPRADDVPALTIAKRETWATTNPLGAKGVGEAGCIAIPPAILNAVHDAIGGEADLSLPLTNETLWRALRTVETRAR